MFMLATHMLVILMSDDNSSCAVKNMNSWNLLNEKRNTVYFNKYIKKSV
jgi:hypothetical protein